MTIEQNATAAAGTTPAEPQTTPAAAAEITEAEAGAIDSLVAGPGAPPAEGAAAQIQAPEVPPAAATQAADPGELPELPDVAGAPDTSGDDGDWREVAKGKRRKARKAEPEPSDDEKPADPPPPLSAAQRKVQKQKAEASIMALGLGFAYFARRWGVPEDQVDFTDDERQSLIDALAPCLKPESDPWGGFLTVAAVVCVPRVQVLNKAAKENKEQAEAAAEQAPAEAPAAAREEP